MPTYEATTEENFKKIEDYLKKQAENSFPKACWHQGSRGKTLRQMREQFGDKLQVFLAEDDSANIQVVLFLLKWKWIDSEVELDAYNFLLILMEESETTYTTEIRNYMLKKAKDQNIPILLSHARDVGVEEYKKFVGENAVQIIKEYESVGKKRYFVKIDLRKAVEPYGF